MGDRVMVTMPTSITEQFDIYDAHFADRGERHAFYMGCWIMLVMSQTLMTDQLKVLAGEIEAFVKKDQCVCEACRQKIANGAPSLVEQLFGGKHD
jgi:hypothetical protein